MTVTDALEAAGISPREGCEADAVAELARRLDEYRDLLRLAGRMALAAAALDHASLSTLAHKVRALDQCREEYDQAVFAATVRVREVAWEQIHNEG